MDLSKAKYILPNSFTLSSVCAGLFSIQLSLTAGGPRDISMAAWLLVVAMVCDLFDGRVARLTKTESELGMQLDSLADAVSFGVAPACLLYAWGLQSWGKAGLFVAFIYLACTILRLARFNVLAAQKEGPSSYFLGLSSPLAAGTVVAVVLAHVSLTDQMTTRATTSVAALSVLLGGLMVSNVRYRTFKDVNFRSARWLATLASVVILAAILAIVIQPGVAFVVLLFGYIGMGLIGSMVQVGRNLRARESDDTLFEPSTTGEFKHRD